MFWGILWFWVRLLGFPGFFGLGRFVVFGLQCAFWVDAFGRFWLVIGFVWILGLDARVLCLVFWGFGLLRFGSFGLLFCLFGDVLGVLLWMFVVVGTCWTVVVRWRVFEALLFAAWFGFFIVVGGFIQGCISGFRVAFWVIWRLFSTVWSARVG